MSVRMCIFKTRIRDVSKAYAATSKDTCPRMTLIGKRDGFSGTLSTRKRGASPDRDDPKTRCILNRCHSKCGVFLNRCHLKIRRFVWNGVVCRYEVEPFLPPLTGVIRPRVQKFLVWTGPSKILLLHKGFKIH